MVETYSGFQSYVLIKKESEWGTAVSPDEDIGVVQNVTPREVNNNIYNIIIICLTHYLFNRINCLFYCFFFIICWNGYYYFHISHPF